jgi:hypothetical protein
MNLSMNKLFDFIDKKRIGFIILISPRKMSFKSKNERSCLSEPLLVFHFVSFLILYL